MLLSTKIALLRNYIDDKLLLDPLSDFTSPVEIFIDDSPLTKKWHDVDPERF